MITVSKDYNEILKKSLHDAPTFAYSILDRVINGNIYADSNNFNSLLFQTDSGLYFVTGDSSNLIFLNEIKMIFEQSIIQHLRFSLFAYTKSWYHAIEGVFDKKVNRVNRYTLSFSLEDYKNRNKIGFSEYAIGHISYSDIEHCLEFDKSYYDEYWDSISKFLQNGIGYCIKDNHTIISECVSIFKSIDFAELDIHTNPNYRGKGLAYLIAEQFIEHCISHNIQPRWDCDIDNTASFHLGNKLGFNHAQEYAIYIKK